MSLLGMTFVQMALSLGIIAVCLLLMLVILVQQASGGGLVGAFGGGGGGGAFGAKTGDMFTLITVILASVYLLFSVVGNYVLLPRGLETAAASVTTTAPVEIPPVDGTPVETEGESTTDPAQGTVTPADSGAGGAGGAAAADNAPDTGDVAGGGSTVPETTERAKDDAGTGG